MDDPAREAAVPSGGMADPVLAFVGVLIGAGVAALASVITALVTARLAGGRETRARLFDARREFYVEALRAVGIARHAIDSPIPEAVAADIPERTVTFMAQMELLGSKAVVTAYGDLVNAVLMLLQLRQQVLPDGGQWGDAEMAQFMTTVEVQTLGQAIYVAETRLRDLMRTDLGTPVLGPLALPADPLPTRPPGDTAPE